MIKFREITIGAILGLICFLIAISGLLHVPVNIFITLSRDVNYSPPKIETSINALTMISTKGHIEEIPDGDYLLVYSKNKSLSIAFQEDGLIKIQQLNIGPHYIFLTRQVAYMHLDKFHGAYIENNFNEDDFEETIPKSNYYYFLHVENGYGEVYFKKLNIEPKDTDGFLADLYTTAKQAGVICK